MKQEKPLPTPAELALLPPDGGAEFNRLVFTKNPYLLQHARNPVDWWEWNDCAFLTAENQGKPVFLSIGYSTCHWCHVMAHESFEDGEVAALLNENFICIKVDREERPDIDHFYMQACMAMTGQGGWPLSVFLLPDRRPFFAGTYYPKHAVNGRHGMLTLLPAICDFWKNRREELVQSAGTLTQELTAHFEQGGEAPSASAEVLEAGVMQWAQRYDREHGGFGGAPKFPVPHQFSFLAKYSRAFADGAALDMATATLAHMIRGGIHDQVGFGWHRYSTDERWLVPHFEKMLYDQALMALALCDAWLETREPHFETAIHRTLAYALRDLRHPEGAFCAAEDADSEGVEGKFYVWTTAEIRRALGEEDGRRACRAWHLENSGNFSAEAGEGLDGANIPHRLEEDPDEPELESLRQKLFELRQARVRPRRDDKILTDWNGLMIAALARAGSVLRRPEYLQEADKAHRFIKSHLIRDGLLHKSTLHGALGATGRLDDWAFYIFGLIHLHQATLDRSVLDEAARLLDQARDRFWDEDRGAFRMSPAETALPVRPLSFHDGALPSGNSVMAWNLIMLGRLCDREAFLSQARRVIFAAGASFIRIPTNHAMALTALLMLETPVQEWVLAGPSPGAADPFLSEIHAHPHPNRTIRLLLPGDTGVPPWMEAMKTTDRVRAFLCEGQACQRPVERLSDLKGLLA